MKEKSAAIIGGEGKMGKLTDGLFKNIGFETQISDIKNKQSPTPTDAARGSRVIFFSVPPEEIPKIINAIDSADKNILPENIVLDNVGVKEPVLNTYHDLASRGSSICSTHPLFGPSADITGQTVLIMPFDKNFKHAKNLAVRLYLRAGINTEDFQIEKHDEAMVIQQLIPHLVMRTIGASITNLNLDFNTLMRTASANSKLFWTSCARVNIQDDSTSQRIIEDLRNSDYGKRVIAIFLKNLERLINGNTDLEVLFGDMKKYFFTGDSEAKVMELTNGVIKYITVNGAKK